MGYNLGIGEATFNVQVDGLKTAISVGCSYEEHPDAPAFGDPSDYKNWRYPSYTVWGQAMRMVGLGDLMKDKHTGLLRNHPGCVPLTIDHKIIIDAAHEKYIALHPGLVPGFSGDDSEDADERPAALARLIWLKYWVDWALTNCENPVFYNS